AEFRLHLREDNADLRLTETGRELGLVDDTRWRHFSARREAIEAERARLSALRIPAQSALGRRTAETLGIDIRKDVTAEELPRRPEVEYAPLMQVEGLGSGVEREDIADQVAIQIRYAGYLDRQRAEIRRQRRAAGQTIPEDFDFETVKGLSSELLEKLERIRPATIDQASRIPGMTPAAISQLLVYLKRHRAAA
ncbi:MAG TPA: tRNA uridine-5-carboxymethylaminomethyl(34) synthesis enzyme MnmG, partial [Wenzhouxiangella sp.]|nr:tRNA uridine-5-carboxymethylaminomethyl(34) synthesis enzyme MnmG [Wenzhouxiangella sp.]